LGAQGKEAVPALARALMQDNQSNDVRLDIIQALAAIGPDAASAAPALTATLNDRSRPVRQQAAAALAKIAK
jgi:HEAT repeat protein